MTGDYEVTGEYEVIPASISPKYDISIWVRDVRSSSVEIMAVSGCCGWQVHYSHTSERLWRCSRCNTTLRVADSRLGGGESSIRTFTRKDDKLADVQGFENWIRTWTGLTGKVEVSIE